MEMLLVAVVIFLSAFIQSMTGFGVALVSMPILTDRLGIGVSAPLIALVALSTKVFILARYRQNFDLRAVIPLVAAALVGIPLGMHLMESMDRDTVVALLGVVISGYALYALVNPRIPRLEHPTWAYGSGFASGILAGAYNVGGPPLIIYGTGRRWDPLAFKGNLQGCAMLNSVIVIANHARIGNYTPLVWHYFLIGIPALAVGLWLGFKLDHRVNAVRFRQMVLILLFFIGLTLIL
jgi:uncharacterized membrane protein YfcA